MQNKVVFFNVQHFMAEIATKLSGEQTPFGTH